MKREREKKKQKPLLEQLNNHSRSIKEEKTTDGNFSQVISTGSTLLDLAISGGRIRGGGLPGGILVEIFGPSGSGKTVLLCEIAGAIQRAGGELSFRDPEARLNKLFAQMFDLNTDEMDYDTPNTVTELFSFVKKWEPKSKSINGFIADSLAALSTDYEMDAKDGDKMGMRRAKEFSEELRKICRIITQKNLLMVCSNQVRVNTDAGPYGQKYTTPGGEAVGFYSSLRLRFSRPEKITVKERIAGKEVSRVVGVETDIEVFKSSIWSPYRKAPVIIRFDYGIDDIRANLQFIKEHTKNTIYTVNDEKLDISLDKSIRMIERQGLESDLKEQTINLWEEIEDKFKTVRKKKMR